RRAADPSRQCPSSRPGTRRPTAGRPPPAPARRTRTQRPCSMPLRSGPVAGCRWRSSLLLCPTVIDWRAKGSRSVRHGEQRSDRHHGHLASPCGPVLRPGWRWVDQALRFVHRRPKDPPMPFSLGGKLALVTSAAAPALLLRFLGHGPAPLELLIYG